MTELEPKALISRPSNRVLARRQRPTRRSKFQKTQRPSRTRSNSRVQNPIKIRNQQTKQQRPQRARILPPQPRPSRKRNLPIITRPSRTRQPPQGGGYIESNLIIISLLQLLKNNDFASVMSWLRLRGEGNISVLKSPFPEPCICCPCMLFGYESFRCRTTWLLDGKRQAFCYTEPGACINEHRDNQGRWWNTFFAIKLYT